MLLQTVITPYYAAQTGLFGVDDISSSLSEGLDLATLVLLVSLKRHDQLEGGVVDQMNGIQDKNNTLAQYRDIINKLKNLELKDKKGESVDLSQKEALCRELCNFFRDHPSLKNEGVFITNPDNPYERPLTIKITSDGAMEKTINNITTEIEKMSGNSQVEMLKLQSSMTRANEIMDFASTFLHKDAEVHKTIIQNL